jgi:CheY-like chemotaxis protein
MACILFIDDDPLTLQLLQKATQILGHEAVLTTNARTALTLVAAVHPDLIIADLNLPDMDGLEFLKAVRRTGALPPPPVLILSAGLPAIDEQQALAAGAREFLSKPLSIDRLDEAIQTHIPSPDLP